jgi:acylphosphatase
MPPVNVVMNRCRVQIVYSGQVQGVGFRYTAKRTAAGFEVTGLVRNLPDGRVELVAEGTREELEGFRQAIREAGLEHFIRNEEVHWSEAQSSFRGFEIAS